MAQCTVPLDFSNIQSGQNANNSGTMGAPRSVLKKWIKSDSDNGVEFHVSIEIVSPPTSNASISLHGVVDNTCSMPTVSYRTRKDALKPPSPSSASTSAEKKQKWKQRREREASRHPFYFDS